MMEEMAAKYCSWFDNYRKKYDRMNDLSTVGNIYYGSIFWANVPIYIGIQKWRILKLNS